MIAYRPEIDGLRAIAVLGVLLFHAGFPALSGGYAGVDVFFVISGYLITRTILTGIDAGRFSYIGFFVNRVRRLFPALLTTIGISFLIGALLFTPPHLKKLAEAAIVSVLGVSNIYFWSEASYWDIESAFKPLLHTWSLAVEEQFYLFWPPLLLMVSRAKNKRIARIVLVATLGLTSLLFAGLLGLHHPRATFFWMPWRAFEFMIGAAVIGLEVVARPRGRLWPEITGGLRPRHDHCALPCLWRSYAVPVSRRTAPVHRQRASDLGRRILPDVETVDQPAHDLDRPYLLFALPRALAADHLLQLLAVRPTYPA